MKCAKCGYDIPEGSASCPGCAAGRTVYDREPNRAACPVCGSPDISALRRNYDPGCGCLGLLVFGWIGLLMGLLGAGKVDLVCRNCGAKWEAGNPASSRKNGCLTLLILIILIILLKHLFC
ncbi:MAG: hypothetical protein IKC65_04835 [Lentisphaeria bacterium]|nr:hypothetical protein [Lentisphaeria bacterium]